MKAMLESLKQLEDLERELRDLDDRRGELLAKIGGLRLATGSGTEEQRGAVCFSPAEKIKLFRSLFRGRENVFPRRFESRKSGRSGYQSVCANEWRSGVCFKPRIKCAKCGQREFVPVSDEVVRQHLSGRDPQGKGFCDGRLSVDGG